MITKLALAALSTVDNDLTLGYQTFDSMQQSSNFHHLALLAFLVVQASHSSNFHHWRLLALLVVLVLH